MSDINELNDKIAELEKQRDALAEKTGGFKVGDKVVLEGVVSEIEASWSFPIKVTMKGGLYDYLRPDHLRHADAVPDAEPVCWANFYGDGVFSRGFIGSRVTFGSREEAKMRAVYNPTETAVPLYRVPPDASKRIEELEKQVADKQAHIQHLEAKLSAQRKVKAGMRQAIFDRNERIKELEADVDLLRDLLTFRSKPTCDTTCDSPDKCCNTKPAEPATTGDDVATDHIVEPNKMTVAPKGVKERIGHALNGIRFHSHNDNPGDLAYVSRGMVDYIRSAVSVIVELPEPNKHVTIQESNFGGFNVLMDSHFWFFVNSHNALPLAAAMVQAARGGAK